MKKLQIVPVNSKINKSLKRGERILSKISDKEYVIVLAIEGKQFPSEKFSQTIDQIMTSGYSNLTFVIGGSLGLSPEVKKEEIY